MGLGRKRQLPTLQKTGGVAGQGSPEDVVGRGEVEAAPVGFLHVTHTHVDEGDADAQVVLLAGRRGGMRTRPRGQGLRSRVGRRGGCGTLGPRMHLGGRGGLMGTGRGKGPHSGP